MDDLQYLREKGESMRAAMGDATFADALLRLVDRVAGLDHSLSDAMEQIEAIQGSNAVHMARVKELEAKLEQVEVKPCEYFAAQMADCLGLSKVPKLMGPYLKRACDVVTRVKELEAAQTPKPMSEAPRDGSWFWIIESAYWMADKGQWLTAHDPSAGWIPGPGPRGDEQLTAPRS